MPRKSRQITIEQDEFRLAVMGEPPPLWPVVLIGIAVVLIVANVVRMIVPMWRREMGRYYGNPTLYAIAAVLTIVLGLAAIAVLARRVARQRLPCGVEIDRGNVLVLTPDDTASEHRFAIVELRAAEMRASAKVSHLADLVLTRREGASVTALRWGSPQAMAPAVDRINALLLIDRYYGFEVIVAGVPYALGGVDAAASGRTPL